MYPEPDTFKPERFLEARTAEVTERMDPEKLRVWLRVAGQSRSAGGDFVMLFSPLAFSN